MISTHWLEKRKRYWSSLEALLDRAADAGFQSLTRAQLQELGLLTEESSQHQYRFKDIIDLDTRRVLFTLEHEVRSMQHPMYARVLVNRNPAQTGMNYRPGRDSMAWSME